MSNVQCCQPQLPKFSDFVDPQDEVRNDELQAHVNLVHYGATFSSTAVNHWVILQHYGDNPGNSKRVKMWVAILFFNGNKLFYSKKFEFVAVA